MADLKSSIEGAGTDHFAGIISEPMNSNYSKEPISFGSDGSRPVDHGNSRLGVKAQDRLIALLALVLRVIALLVRPSAGRTACAP
jgi:hypothetical protein